MSPRLRAFPGPRRQAGMGLVEMLVVVLISMFMMAGLLSLVWGTRQNFTAQTQLAQLQDNERMATNVIGNVVQAAGYFHDPKSEKISTAFPSTGTLAASNGHSLALGGSQIIGGATYSSNDEVWVRFKAGTGSFAYTLDCNGQSNSSGAVQTDVNHLYVSGNTLYCEVFTNGTEQTPQALVPGIKSMTVLYGVNLAGATPPSASLYMTAAQVTAGAYWNSVVSAQVTLTFDMAGLYGNSTASGATVNEFKTWTPTITRTFDLLNRI